MDAFINHFIVYDCYSAAVNIQVTGINHPEWRHLKADRAKNLKTIPLDSAAIITLYTKP